MRIYDDGKCPLINLFSRKIIFYEVCHFSTTRIRLRRISWQNIKSFHHFSNRKVFLSFTSLKPSSYFFSVRFLRKVKWYLSIAADETEFRDLELEYLETQDIGNEIYSRNILVKYFLQIPFHRIILHPIPSILLYGIN